MFLDNIKMPKITPLTILLLFQLIYISHSFYGELTQKVKFQLENNKILRHLLIFLMVLVVVAEIYKKYDYKTILLYSVILYVLLVALTRMSAQWFIGLFVLLCVYHLYTTHREEKVNSVLNNTLINYNVKEKIDNQNNRDQLIHFGLFVTLIVVGTLFYERHKMQKHQGQFRLVKFIFN